MPKIVSVGIAPPPHVVSQDTVVRFAKELFGDTFKDINRLLRVFENGQVEKRHFVKDLSWFERDHTFEERNNAYIENSVSLGVTAIQECLQNQTFLKTAGAPEEIEAIFFISSTGIATPTIDAKIMNVLPFHPHTKRIPIWGLGCAGGAVGLSRAFEYCKAFPKAKVLVLAIELCSLTFQRNDISKSNLIGTSLFADGAACVLITGNNAAYDSSLPVLPVYRDSQSTLMKDAEDVMGWDIRNNGLYVIFSKDIPTIIKNWLRPNVEGFLARYNMTVQDIAHFVAHPGGKKVLQAYEEALDMHEEKTQISLDILRQYGNMSSATVLYVLSKYMQMVQTPGETGLIAALGPGFSSELILVEWEEV
ncbi:type III polyketide synthase [Ectobacillus sp. JY-23]|uniref:type III polyketide synthase n=1 Tax=Ectobacillus sp. JY-23 TaxID=2933872 RepID=UPI001FF4364D|nr:3-oxoacyl-[acyl-carrier-protein] synthase III C-terminal domain-containing protein [Ectobacillus sp. JY-23]UOY93419.1 type III polyketide synthase [Ectobacillus sp. JY-23]